MRRRYQEGGLAAGTDDEDLDDSNEEVMDPDADPSDVPAGAVTQSGGLAALDIPGAKEAFALMAKSSEQARQALQQARTAIMARHYSKADALLAASAALGAPTRAGSTAESFGAMAGALRQPLAAKREFETQQQKDLLGVNTQMAGLDERQATAQLALAQLRAKLMAQGANATNDRVIGPDGKLHYASHAQARAPGVVAWAPRGTQLTVDQRGETEQSKAINKFYGEDFASAQKAAREAPVEKAKYQRLGDLLEGINGGKLTPKIADLQSYANSFGIHLNPKLQGRLGAIQAAESITSGLALQLRNPAEGGGMPGSLSNSDREYLRSMVPGAGTSPEGRKLMIDAAIKLKDRDQEVAQQFRAYLKKHGKIDGDFYDDLQKWSDEHPLFPKEAPGATSTAHAAVEPEVPDQQGSNPDDYLPAQEPDAAPVLRYDSQGKRIQ